MFITKSFHLGDTRVTYYVYTAHDTYPENIDKTKRVYFIIKCPNCFNDIFIYKDEINCHIFRHAVFKDTLQNINPHTPKDECDRLVNAGLVIGCAMPFQIILMDTSTDIMAEKCDYI
jgi:hypothetical protein